MFDFLSPISATLTEKLESPNPVMEEILEEPSCLRAFRSNSENLVRYFVNNAQTLVDLCFDLEKQQISTKAYNILSIENLTLQRKLMDDDLLQAIADKIFPTKEPICINRFAVITKNCCNAFPGQTFVHCSNFLDQFIEFMAQPSVYEMFISFFIPNYDDDKTLAQNFLERDFQNHFISAISSAPKEFSSEFGDPNVPYLAALFKFFAEIASNKNSWDLFSSSISTPTTINILATTFQDAPPYLLGYQYATIKTIATHSLEKFAFLTPRLISFTQVSSDSNAFHEHQVYAINLLASLAKEELDRKENGESIESLLIEGKSPIDLMYEANIISSIADIVRRFPGHTIAHSAISTFILSFKDVKISEENDQEAKVEEKFKVSIFETLVTLLNEILGESKRAEQKAFAWNLVKALLKEDVSLKYKLKLNEQATTQNNRLNDIYNKENYGGELPEKPQDDIPGNITPEQMMMLIRLLTGGK